MALIACGWREETWPPDDRAQNANQTHFAIRTGYAILYAVLRDLLALYGNDA